MLPHIEIVHMYFKKKINILFQGKESKEKIDWENTF